MGAFFEIVIFLFKNVNYFFFFLENYILFRNLFSENGNYN